MSLSSIDYYDTLIKISREHVKKSVPSTLEKVYSLRELFEDNQQDADEINYYSNTLTQSILDSLNSTIAVLDVDGTIIAVNEAWKRLAKEESPPESREHTGIGMNYLQVCRAAQEIGAEHAEEAYTGIRAILQGTQEYFAMEYPCFTPTYQGWYLMQATPLVQGQGAVVTHIDITERKQFELALQHANSLFDFFLSIASHELKTPLAGIRGNIQLALRRLKKLELQEIPLQGNVHRVKERLQGPLEEALHRVLDQDRLINDLLNASSIRANQLEMMMGPCDLVDIVRRAIENTQYQAQDRVIHVHWPAEETLPIIADAQRIGQVVSNYLSNALKYSAHDKPVEVWVTREGATARLAVGDEGPGLTAEEQVTAWERFRRIEGIKVRYGRGTGLGLGLYLSRTIIDYHGGRVGVNSTKGRGSLFWFTLPLSALPE